MNLIVIESEVHCNLIIIHKACILYVVFFFFFLDFVSGIEFVCFKINLDIFS